VSVGVGEVSLGGGIKALGDGVLARWVSNRETGNSVSPKVVGISLSISGHFGYGYLGHYYGKRSADAEADPYYLGGYALPYAAHGVVAAAVPFGSSTGLDPITQGLDASTQGYAPYAYGYLGHYYG